MAETICSICGGTGEYLPEGESVKRLCGCKKGGTVSTSDATTAFYVTGAKMPQDPIATIFDAFGHDGCH